jgi:Leucine-rich repeat (LRR) protein
MTDENLKDLISEWIRLKTSETEINKDRITIEKNILDILELKEVSDEFKMSIEDNDLTLIPSITKKVDGDILAQIVKDNDLKEEFKIAFKREYKIDSVKFKTLSENIQTLFNKSVSIKYNKPTFKIEKIEKPVE